MHYICTGPLENYRKIEPIQGDLDKVLSDTMDIQIKNALEQLSNSTFIGNNGQSVPRFQTKVPSGVDVFEVGHISTTHHH